MHLRASSNFSSSQNDLCLIIPADNFTFTLELTGAINLKKSSLQPSNLIFIIVFDFILFSSSSLVGLSEILIFRK